MSLFSYWRVANFTRKQPFKNAQGSGLRRVLSLWQLLGFAIANIIGAGIFVTSGEASLQAGSSLVFAFILAGFAALLSALCYAEYAARFPVSGSSYTFTYISLGEALAWFIGWNMTLEYAVGASALAAGWAGNIITFVHTIFPGFVFPPWVNNYKLVWEFSLSPLAVLIIVLCTIVLFFGASESATFNMIMSTINVIIILFIIILGATLWNPNNWNNFFGPGVASKNFNGILAAAGTIFYSYIGFDSVTTLSGEAINPNRDLPLAIILSLLISTLLYVGVAVVLTGLVTSATINTDSPLASAFQVHHLRWAVIIIAVGSITTLTANVLASLFGQPRIFFQMAVDGLFFKPFGWINKRGVITVGTIVTFIISSTLALLYNLDSLSHMISAGTLLAYGTVCIGVILLRYGPESETDEYTRLVSSTYFSRTNSYGNFVKRFLPLYILLYLASSIVIGLSLQLSWPVEVIGVFGGVDFLIYLSIQLLRPTNVPETFKCPLVPLIPLCGILINVLLFTALPLEALERVVVWSFIGAVIYLFYGIRNSKLNYKDVLAPAGPLN